jgi:hypothetical protein
MYILFRAVRATDDNTAHAHGIVYTQDYKHTISISNICCFYTQQWIHERASNVRYSTCISCVGKRRLLTLTVDILFQRRVSVYLAAV